VARRATRDRPGRRIFPVAGIVLVGALLRGPWVAWAAAPLPFISDPTSYVRLGDRLATGRGYTSWVGGEPTAFFPPGYPGLLGAVFWLTDHTPLPDDRRDAADLVNIAAGAAAIWLIILVVSCVFSRREALMAGALVAVFPNLVFYSATPHHESVFIVSVLAVLAVLVPVLRTQTGPAPSRLLAAGALLGVSMLVRPLLAPLPLLFAIVGLAAGWGWRRSVVSAALLALPVVALVGAWTVRNAVAMDAFVPISTNSGDTLCIDHHRGSTGDFRGAGTCIDDFVRRDPREEELERNRVNTRRAVRFVIRHPLRELRQLPTRLGASVDHGHDGLDLTKADSRSGQRSRGARRLLRTVADVVFFVTLGLAALALPTLLRRGEPERLLVLATIGCLLLAPLGLYGYTRFWVPLLPFQAMLAVHTVNTALEWLRQGRLAGAG